MKQPTKAVILFDDGSEEVMDVAEWVARGDDVEVTATVSGVMTGREIFTGQYDADKPDLVGTGVRVGLG